MHQRQPIRTATVQLFILLYAGCKDPDATGSDVPPESETVPATPEGCEALPIDGITLLSLQQLTFDASDPVPVVRTPFSIHLTGNARKFDRLRILFDAGVGVGAHPLDGDPNRAVPTYVQTFIPTCSACVVYEEDMLEYEYRRTFVASGGTLEISDVVTPHQTRGSVSQVELREVALDPVTGRYGAVENGACYWFERATFDVRRPNGCVPYAEGSCADGQFCMPTNAVGSDGECVEGGEKGVGEACVPASDAGWGSDCQLGSRCIDFGGGASCEQVCDVLSANNGCGAGTHCGGGYNLCLTEADLEQSGIDAASLGEACGDPTALYCGGSGQVGTCWDDDGDGPLNALCIPFHTAASECSASETAGFIAYKGGLDLSTLFCLDPTRFAP